MPDHIFLLAQLNPKFINDFFLMKVFFLNLLLKLLLFKNILLALFNDLGVDSFEVIKLLLFEIEHIFIVLYIFSMLFSYLFAFLHHYQFWVQTNELQLFFLQLFFCSNQLILHTLHCFRCPAQGLSLFVFLLSYFLCTIYFDTLPCANIFLRLSLFSIILFFLSKGCEWW